VLLDDVLAFSMPPLPRISTPALAGLAQQLRFAPADALRRDIDRAEALAAEIDPAQTYPEDWLVFRITGYRPDLGAPAMIAGSSLLADLSALVERLCDAAHLLAAEMPDAVPAPVLAARWAVSRKTLDRCRKSGLIARRVIGDESKPFLVFTPSAIAAYERRDAARLREAAAFTRIPPELEARMIRRAARYRRRFKCSLNAAAERLARRYGRAHETVRQLLRRHDRGARAEHAIFSEPGLLTDRQKEAVFRAWLRAVEPGDMARRYGRSRAAIHRAINEARAQRLRGLDLPAASGAPASAVATNLDPVLAPVHVRTGLGAPGETDLLAFIESARATGAPLGVEELARSAAYHALLCHAAARAAALPASGAGAEALDQIETALRWAARLKAELVRSQLPLMIRTLEGAIGRPLEQLRAGELIRLITDSIAAIAHAVDQFDPATLPRPARLPRAAKPHSERPARAPADLPARLASPASIALSRVASAWVKTTAPPPASSAPSRLAATAAQPQARPRATTRLTPGTDLADWTLRIAPWQAWLEPRAAVRHALERLPDRSRLFLIARFGWAVAGDGRAGGSGTGGGPPHTLTSLAATFRTTRIQAARLELRALHAALGLVRGGTERRERASRPAPHRS
jgi:RNA polymerase primary sigma factor